MDCIATRVPYAETGFFSKIIVDYLQGDPALKDFYNLQASVSGVKAAIENRTAYPTDRNLLIRTLKEQYKDLQISSEVSSNIQKLIDTNTFTITTAHQPNIFTGPLFFIYKILHAIKLAKHCKTVFPQYDFVPVYYMGSEDADLDELGHLYINAEKLIWQTDQTGAVGRMKVDTPLLRVFDEIKQRTGIFPFAGEIFDIIQAHYKTGANVQQATLGFVNTLFGKYGLVVVTPDNPYFKSAALEVFKYELLNSHSASIVAGTIDKLLNAGYKGQAHSRPINLFYLQNDARSRIEKNGSVWKVSGTNIVFNEEQLMKELTDHPERFSPNVILRGLFQEMLLPDIAFIGGGGELAYWMQLKELFEFYKVPYPLLLLRNSFLLIEKKYASIMHKLGFDAGNLFASEKTLQDIWIRKNAGKELSVYKALQSIDDIYLRLQIQAGDIDKTLTHHTDALKTNARKKVEILGKKMLRAEKRNHQDAMRKIQSIKKHLFPLGSLQERIENFIPFYAKYGSAFIDALYENSLAFEQELVILKEV